jgi:hypothetical protein
MENAMNVAAVGGWVALMVMPTAALAAAVGAPAVLRRVRRRWRRHGGPRLTPTRPPIEQLAADLRRLLGRHEALMRSTQVAVRGQKRLALEAAISDCAMDAAGALEVACPARSGRAALPTPELRNLLHGLAANGLVIEPLTGVFAADDRG